MFSEDPTEIRTQVTRIRTLYANQLHHRIVSVMGKGFRKIIKKVILVVKSRKAFSWFIFLCCHLHVVMMNRVAGSRSALKKVHTHGATYRL